MIDIPEGFDINILKLLDQAYENDFKRGKDTIGCSSLSSCERSTILKKIHGVKTPSNPKMLMGSIMGVVLAQPTMLEPLISMINESFGITNFTHITTEPVLTYEVLPNRYLQGHVDVNTNHYLIEIKTTWVYVREWVKEIAKKYFIQANTYCGIQGVKLGFVATLNMRAFMAKFNSWSELWEKYGYFIPFTFNQELFDQTIKKARMMFRHIDANDPNVECHPESWECNYCEVAYSHCGKTDMRCEHVNEKGKQKGKQCPKMMKVWYEILTPEFLDHPICQHCYENKTLKRKEYLTFKQSKPYPWIKI